MKVVPYRRSLGNIKMKGLKSCGLSCYCCTVSNNSGAIIDRAVKKEMLEHLNTDASDAIYYDWISDNDNANVANDHYYEKVYKHKG